VDEFKEQEWDDVEPNAKNVDDKMQHQSNDNDVDHYEDIDDDEDGITMMNDKLYSLHPN